MRVQTAKPYGEPPNYIYTKMAISKSKNTKATESRPTSLNGEEKRLRESLMKSFKQYVRKISHAMSVNTA
jgi:hypothetical protein